MWFISEGANSTLLEETTAPIDTWYLPCYGPQQLLRKQTLLLFTSSGWPAACRAFALKTDVIYLQRLCMQNITMNSKMLTSLNLRGTAEVIIISGTFPLLLTPFTHTLVHWSCECFSVLLTCKVNSFRCAVQFSDGWLAAPWCGNGFCRASSPLPPPPSAPLLLLYSLR